MIARHFWMARLESAWRQAPIAWLSGVRRSGKTTLARALDPERTHFLNCDRPDAEEAVRDPVGLFRGCGKPILVFDEVHRLRDPSRVLKIGADEFPEIRILATGSSTLAATGKFRDSLTGRKRQVHLVPVLWRELEAFGVTLPRRLSRGGLPEALLAPEGDPLRYREWLDSFFARDIQHLFDFRGAGRFTAFFEYLLRQSGGLLEKSRAAAKLGVSRPTIDRHLSALEITHAVTVVRPFHGGGQGEIVRMPRVYGFDTGFVVFARGWDPLRPEDLGVLWEHLVLEHLQAHFPHRRVLFWRDKAGHEIDFVLEGPRDAVDAVECKWNAADFDPGPLRVFRRLHPLGRNLVVAPTDAPPYSRRFGDLEVKVCNPAGIG